MQLDEQTSSSRDVFILRITCSSFSFLYLFIYFCFKSGWRKQKM